jgi:hypothetical protein
MRLAVALGSVVLVVAPASGDPLAEANAAIEIHAPSTIEAGTALTLDVVGVEPDAELTLLVISSVGATHIEVEPADSSQREVHIPSTIAAVAGDLTIIALGARPAATATVSILPGPAVNPLITVVGARSIVADGADLAMAVVIPTDSFGNAVATGVDVTFFRRQPDGLITQTRTDTLNQLAWAELSSHTVAGNGEVWTEIGSLISGPRSRLEEVAGVPVLFALDFVSQYSRSYLPADGRSLTAIRTDVLRDRFGNVQPDGTQVLFEWVSGTGTGRIASETIAGVATIYVQAPSRPDSLEIVAQSRGVSSKLFVISFESAIRAFDVDISLSSTGYVVDMGPIERQDGSLVTDGTRVTVQVEHPDRIDRYFASTTDGTASVNVMDTQGGFTVTVDVLGRAIEVSVP